MARLNEPPAPMESVDTVKRRFLRQNRDLAKCNSNQSVRIRNLELEMSRLLAENLSLREEIIQLNVQMEKYQHQPPPESICAIKNSLEEKMKELGALVAGLSNLQSASPQQNKLPPTATKKSPEERNWKNPMMIPEAMGADLLPTITEDKFFPRRTLEPAEIQTLVSEQPEESPDLGPPPVVHFADEDPIKFDPVTSSSPDDRKDDIPVLDSIPPALSVNLETRRKRRDSSRLEIRRISVYNPGSEQDESDSAQVSDGKERPRIGAKRKLSVRDDDDSTSNPRQDEFKFTRKAGPATEAAAASARRQSVEASKRKILGAKTTNADASPRKATVQKGKEVDGKPDVSLKPDAEELKPSKRADVRQPKFIADVAPAGQENDLVQTAEIPLESLSVPPKTPAVLEAPRSPISTEPSTARPETRDTPPPTDLGLIAADQANGVRPSRRARAAVNYAEPNLVSKMRRPTAELVDAVAKGARTSTGGTLSAKKDGANPPPPTVERLKDRSAVIKRERDDAPTNWQSIPDSLQEPASPLSKKTEEACKQEEKRQQPSQEADAKQSGSSATISALMGGSSRTKKRSFSRAGQEASGNDSDVERMAGRLDNMAIYDFADSSPRDGTTDASDGERKRSETSRARQARRHSSTSSLSSSRDPSSSAARRSAELKSLRAGGHASSTTGSSTSSGHTDTEASRSSLLAAKAERASSRRRSMML